jgi:hypothetical protein
MNAARLRTLNRWLLYILYDIPYLIKLRCIYGSSSDKDKNYHREINIPYMSKLRLRFLSHFDRHKMKTTDVRLQESIYSKNHFPYNQQTVLLMNRQDLRGPL